MRILTFHLKGKMAHFRRYYSNSSALSYSVPPRTTVTGIIAGLLGYKRDSYYTDFSRKSCKIAVACIAPLKKQMQKVNLLHVEKIDYLNGSKSFPSQTPTEIVMPLNIRSECLDYQIWFSHEDGSLIDTLKETLISGPLTFGSKGISLALGTASNLGWLELNNETGEVAGSNHTTSEAIEIVSTLPARKIMEIIVSTKSHYRLVREELPLEFDSERRIADDGIGPIIINLKPFPIIAKVTDYTKLSDGSNIVWME